MKQRVVSRRAKGLAANDLSVYSCEGGARDVYKLVYDRAIFSNTTSLPVCLLLSNRLFIELAGKLSCPSLTNSNSVHIMSSHFSVRKLCAERNVEQPTAPLRVHQIRSAGFSRSTERKSNS